jgi:hypothetical protein
MRQLWDQIGNLARLAPTPHNTQPFRIRPRTHDSADLLLVCDRLLPEEDHGNLYVLSSFGIFATALERAALHVGRILDVAPIEGLDPSKLTLASGTITIGTASIRSETSVVAQDELLALRRTSRLPYEDRVVDPAAIDAMTRAAHSHGHRFIGLKTADEVRAMLRMNTEAILDNLLIARERNEIRGWYRYGPTPENGDGLWEQPMNQPAWELRSAFQFPAMLHVPGLHAWAISRYLRTQRGTLHVAALTGPFRTWPELIKAGRALFDTWLAMAKHNVYMQPFGSMLTNPVYAAKVAEKFAADDVWLVFRFGYSEAPPRAPRLASIVVE